MKSINTNNKLFARYCTVLKCFAAIALITAISTIPQDATAEYNFIAATTAVAQTVVEDDNSTAEEKTTQAADKPDSNKEEFSYQLENRKDPFSPFLTSKATTSSAEIDEIVDTSGRLTGMQLFEPGQLNLVGLLQTSSDKFAMVEDVTGKGYIITEGTKIGRRGVVKKIIPNKVLIEETALTRSGKKIVTQIVMALKKEGDE